MLDRNIERNGPGAKGARPLLFLKCADSSMFTDLAANWNPPAYVFSNRYIESLSGAARENAEFELAVAQANWPKYEAILQAEDFELSRRAYFENMGLANPGIHPAQAHRSRRITHCWACKRPLDNAFDVECNSCNWIVCACGACGCGI